MKQKRKLKPARIGWSPLEFVSVGLAAASGRLPLDAWLAYLHVKPRPRKSR